MAAKKKRKKAKSPSPAYEFVVKTLKRRPKASYAEIRDAAAQRRLTVYPIVYGRAQAALGIVKSKKRGSKKAAAKRRGPGRPPKRRGPGRPPKSANMDSLESVIAGVRDLERERDQMRKVLDQIQVVLDKM